MCRVNPTRGKSTFFRFFFVFPKLSNAAREIMSTNLPTETLRLQPSPLENHRGDFYVSHVIVGKGDDGVLLGSWSLSQLYNHGYLGNVYL